MLLAECLLDFAEICPNLAGISEIFTDISLNLQVSMIFFGGGTKPRKKIGHDPAARPLAGAEVFVPVGGPSPRRGGRRKNVLTERAGADLGQDKPCVVA